MTNIILGIALGSPCTTGGGGPPFGYSFLLDKNGDVMMDRNSNPILMRVN